MLSVFSLPIVAFLAQHVVARRFRHYFEHLQTRSGTDFGTQDHLYYSYYFLSTLPSRDESPPRETTRSKSFEYPFSLGSRFRFSRDGGVLSPSWWRRRTSVGVENDTNDDSSPAARFRRYSSPPSPETRSSSCSDNIVCCGSYYSSQWYCCSSYRYHYYNIFPMTSLFFFY